MRNPGRREFSRGHGICFRKERRDRRAVETLRLRSARSKEEPPPWSAKESSSPLGPGAVETGSGQARLQPCKPPSEVLEFFLPSPFLGEEDRTRSMRPRKIKTLAQMKAVVARLKGRGKKVVFTNGCFDILHVGHVRYLRRAKTQGDVLVIGLNTDRSVREIKGEKRPIVPEKERAEVLAALEFVDYVVPFDEPDPFRLIGALKPNVLVKGADWPRSRIIGREIVEKIGGRVVRVPLVAGASSTGLIEKILKTYRR